MGFFFLAPFHLSNRRITSPPVGTFVKIKSGDTFCITAPLRCIVLFRVGVMYLKLISKLTQQA